MRMNDQNTNYTINNFYTVSAMINKQRHNVYRSHYTADYILCMFIGRRTACAQPKEFPKPFYKIAQLWCIIHTLKSFRFDSIWTYYLKNFSFLFWVFQTAANMKIHKILQTGWILKKKKKTDSHRVVKTVRETQTRELELEKIESRRRRRKSRSIFFRSEWPIIIIHYY